MIPLTDIAKKMKEEFITIFGKEGENWYFAPGRVNLIGEHTDYNGGHVFPCALDVGTYALVRKRTDRLCRLASINFRDQGSHEVSVEELTYESQHDWANYPKGVMAEFSKKEPLLMGFDILYYGNIPNGAGLSSSASIEMVTAVLLNEELSFGLGQLELVKLSQRAENEFVGVQCGILDQFASGMCKKDHALILDTNSLFYEQVPLLLEDYTLIIANTNVKRGLADSAYNQRRAECEKASSILQVAELGLLSYQDLLKKKELFQEETIYKRARHAITENERTLAAKLALEKQDMKAFGALMNASHDSLRDDYEVTGQALDTLVEGARKFGAIGARMTGAGFGGCTVNLVPRHLVKDFIKRTGDYYQDRMKKVASFYEVATGDGAKAIKEEEVK